MTVKKKALPKKKAVKKHAAKKKQSQNKKTATAKKKAVATPEKANKKVQAEQSDGMVNLPDKGVKKRAVRKRSAKNPVVKKPRARSRRLGPIPKLHINHLEWDKVAVMHLICDKMMCSSKGIAYICSENNDLPDISTVFRWFIAEERDGAESPCCDMYTTARQMQVEFLVDENMDIVDNQVGNPVVIDNIPVIVDGKIVKVVDSASVAHAKLRSDNRRWAAEKLVHRKYGNKLEVSSDPERPLSTVSDDDLDSRILMLQKKVNELN